MPNHVSLKDVARKAGVSFQTTSKVLNNKGTVAPATQMRIRSAAAELGYVPNALARGLITRSTSLIGVVASDMSQPMLMLPVSGIEREAQRQGFNVIIGSISRSGDNSETVLRTLLERRVDGIILAAPKIEENQDIAALVRGRIPVASTHDIGGGGIPIVRTDEERVGLQAASHLISLGHRHIGTIVGAYDRHVSQRRLTGFQQALTEAGIPFSPSWIEEGDWEVEGAYQAAHRLLDRTPSMTAIFAQNDTMAVGVLAAIYDRGLRVPDDCAVVGCDDIPIAARSIPPLTTFRIPFYEVGETAARLLFELIAGRAVPTGEVLLSASPVYRASSGVHRGGQSTNVLSRDDSAEAASGKEDVAVWKDR